MPASPLMLRLPEILRAAGCEVIEYPGWQDRGRPGSFDPRGLMLHHDGSPAGPAQPAEVYARFLFEIGRPAEGIPGPLCQCWIDFYGRWWIGAAGRANHAGLGDGWGAIRQNLGNTDAIGVEMDNTTGEPTTADQWEALHRGLPAIHRAASWEPINRLTAHKEYARGRKSDPDDVDMPPLRQDVHDLMADPLDPEDPMQDPDPEDAVATGTIKNIGLIQPGESRPVVVPTPFSPYVKIGAVWFSGSWGDNQPDDDQSVAVYGKQFRGVDEGAAVGLWPARDEAGVYTWGVDRKTVPPRARFSAQLIPGCSSLWIKNESGLYAIDCQLEIGPAA